MRSYASSLQTEMRKRPDKTASPIRSTKPLEDSGGIEPQVLKDKEVSQEMKTPLARSCKGYGSGQQDSNLRPSAPKADALARLRYAPLNS